MLFIKALNQLDNRKVGRALHYGENIVGETSLLMGEAHGKLLSICIFD